MSNLQNMLIQSLGYSANTNSINNIISLLNNNTTSTTSTTSTTTDNRSFALLLAQMNRNLECSQIDSSISSLGSNRSTSMNKTSTAPNISAIAQKIKDDNNEILGIDEQVAQYLLENYGGSKADVIMSLTGAQGIPMQMTALQDPIFKTIVSKISTQVRNTMYSGQDLSGLSSDDMSTDSSISDSSISADDI